MIKSEPASRHVASRARFQPLIRFTGCLSLVTALLATGAASSPSSLSPEEQYISIMATIDRADALRKAGNLDAAHARYVEAEKALRAFKSSNPVFFPKTVAYRLKEVTERADERMAVPAQTNSAPKAGANLEAEPATKSNVKLLEAGAEPRTVLRYHVKAGDKHTATLTMKVKLDLPPGATAGPGGAPQATPDIPEVSFPMNITVQSVAANGDITYQTVMGDVVLTQATNTAPEIAQGMQTALAGIKGITGTTIMTSRGLVKKMDTKLPANANAQARQYMDQIKEAATALSAELPEAAVGVGAKWEVNEQTKVQGSTVDEKTSYELTAMDGGTFTTKFNEDMEATAGGKTAASGMGTSVTGTSSVDLSKVVPSGEAHIHTEVPMGKDKSVIAKMDVSMSIVVQ